MNGSNEFEQLRDLLVAPEATALSTLERGLDALRRQIHDPETLALILRSAITRVFLRGDRDLSLAVIKAITPLLEQAIRDRTMQDPAGMASALAPASTNAIALQYASAPEEAAQNLAPLVSAAIKQQIRDERDTMIDALYPVIGSTISKYISQTLNTLIQSINQKIEAHFSVKSFTRRIRAQFLGLSEAELLLRESMPWSVDAAFLIHKGSGLVIALSQNPAVPGLDPDLLSGMLTAIRNLFNESLVSGGDRELDQIEYGDSKIVLEVAGFCYLAAVVRGVPDQAFRIRLRETMSSIVQCPGSDIENYNGDPASVPAPVSQAVTEFVRLSSAPSRLDKSRRPYGVIMALCCLLLIVVVPMCINIYRNSIDREQASKVASALASASPSTLQGVRVEAERGVIRLSGTTANEHQRTRAGMAAGAAVPEWTIENLIIPEAEPPLQVLTETRVQEVAAMLNRMEGVFIDASYHDGSLSVLGGAPDSSTAANITRTFDGLPGIRSMECDVNVGAPLVATRLYFELNSAIIRPGELSKLATISQLLNRMPMFALTIIGHSDQVGNDRVNRRVSQARAHAVRAALVRLRIPGSKLRARGTAEPPPGSASSASDSLSRCVRFELVHMNNR